MKIKELTVEEYEQLLEEEQKGELIVSELEQLKISSQMLVVAYPEDKYKILKYPKSFNAIDQETEEKLNIMVTKEELEKFIFLYCI